MMQSQASAQDTQLVFDAGALAPDNPAQVQLTPETTYTTERGFGWLQAPDTSFERMSLSRTRRGLQLDGVAGDSLVFHADIETGTWWLMLWLEAGREDSSTLKLTVQGTPIPLNWQVFNPPAEPRKRWQRIMRIARITAEVSTGKLTFGLFAGADSVRLLGFSLIPDSEPSSSRESELLSKIRQAGTFQQQPESINSLLLSIQAANKAQPTAFQARWQQELEILALAERHRDMMGWEKHTLATGLSIFDRYHQSVMLLDGLLDHAGPDYPLRDRILWQRMRLIYWLMLERGGPGEKSGYERDIATLSEAFPKDTLVAMYSGERIEDNARCVNHPPHPNAPEWSAMQQRVLCRLRQIIHWWVQERQAENGEFGGKLGDDVEILRWWAPVILAGDTLGLYGWQKLADCVWNSYKVHRGYSAAPLDVEHASEFIADTAPLLSVFSENAEYTERLAYSAAYFDTLWTGKSNHGRRYFKSAWFSSTEVLDTPPRNRDLAYNTRAAKAVRYYAWRTGDASTIVYLHEWSQAWTHAAARTDKGKPVGLFPASIRFPDEAINGDAGQWYKPEMFWDYFDWQHGAGGKMLDQLIFTWTLTGDAKLLQPMHQTLALIKRDHKAFNASIAGSPAWAASHLKRSRSFWSAVERWRLLSGETQYDALLLQFGSPYLKYRISGERQHLVDGLARLFEEVRYNTPMLTSEPLVTDRTNARGYEILQAMLTGDGTPESMSPYFAVSWQETGDTFTSLVTAAGANHLSAEIFLHETQSRKIQMRLWQLESGEYTLQIKTPNAELLKQISISNRGERVQFRIPGGALTTITIAKR